MQTQPCLNAYGNPSCFDIAFDPLLIGNMQLALMFVQERESVAKIQLAVRHWFQQNFPFLSPKKQASSRDADLVTTAIVDGWLVGLGKSWRHVISCVPTRVLRKLITSNLW